MSQISADGPTCSVQEYVNGDNDLPFRNMIEVIGMNNFQCHLQYESLGSARQATLDEFIYICITVMVKKYRTSLLRTPLCNGQTGFPQWCQL